MAGPVLAGSLQVRVRRDADEQLVLAHVTNRLSPLVPHLTVQVLFFKTFLFSKTFLLNTDIVGCKG